MWTKVPLGSRPVPVVCSSPALTVGAAGVGLHLRQQQGAVPGLGEVAGPGDEPVVGQGVGGALDVERAGLAGRQGCEGDPAVASRVKLESARRVPLAIWK